MKPRGLLFDLDGVFHVGDQLLPGAVEILADLRSQAIPFRIVTNTTTLSRASLVAKVSGMGLPLEAGDIVNAAHAATLFLRQLPNPLCRFVVSADTRADFAEFDNHDVDPEYIVLGDIEDQLSHSLLDSIFRQMIGGAELIALHKGRFWQTAGGLKVDLGLFVAGLEYTTGKAATVIGKPSPLIFQLALAELRLRPDQCAMIGDDLHNDIGGAQAAGIRGVLIRTGKYRPGYEDSSTIKPDLVINSLADVRSLL